MDYLDRLDHQHEGSSRERTEYVPTLSEALFLILDHVDYTSGNCNQTEMVGAVLPKEVIELAKRAISNYKFK